jgi:hypothetical protein
MAINIKELFDADADNIKVDKINYNFDQLLASGGGPIGIKGNDGQSGQTGQKGDTGNTGSKGEVGDKGDSGASSSLWAADVVVDGGAEVRVLRPIDIDPDPAEDPDSIAGRRTRVVLGDDTYTNPIPAPDTPTSLLTLINPPVANGDITTQIILLNEETGSPKEFKITTDYTSGSGTTMTLTALAAASGEESNLNITIPNKINILSEETKVDSNTETHINSNGDINIKNNNSGDINIGDLADTANVYIKSELLSQIESDGIINLSSPDINIVSLNGTIDLTSFGGDVSINSDTISALTTSTIELAGSNISIKGSASGQGVDIEAESGYGGRINLIVGGSTKFKLESSLSTSNQSIYMAPTGLTLGGTWDQVNGGVPATGLVADVDVDLGHGIRFPQGSNSNLGGDSAAANYGSAIEQRTFADYFYNPDVNLWGASSTMKYASPLKCLNLQNTTSGTPFDPTTTPDAPLWYNEGASVNGWGSVVDHQRNLYSNLISSSNYGNFAYVKTGNLINAWGEIIVGSNTVAPTVTPNTGGAYPADAHADYWSYYSVVDPQFSNTVQFSRDRQALMLLLNLAGEFPYLNSSKTAVHVDVQVKADSDGGFFTGYGHSSSGRGSEFPGTVPNPITSIENGLSHLIDIKGIINPNSNRIVFLYDSMNPNRKELGDTGDGQVNDIYTQGLSPSMVYQPNADWFPGITLRFKFTMPTHINSYNNRVVNTSNSSNLSNIND